ncbi:MAG TPA: twin-arginine translocation signal domain-containing protein [Blastocatellia bacterium]|jgi:hypothetical protein
MKAKIRSQRRGFTALSRRDFLRTTALACATITLGNVSLGSLAGEVAAVPISTPTWVDKPMRWAQLTLVEDHRGEGRGRVFQLPLLLELKRRHSIDLCWSNFGKHGILFGAWMAEPIG